MDVLRGIVGDSELYYLGKSYGTYLGATYAELFPKNAGRLVLDGAVDPAAPTEQISMAQAKGFDTALDAFAADCAQRSCELGDTKEAVLAAVDKVLADSDAKPLSGDGSRQVGQGLAVLGVIFPLYVKDYWPRLEKAVADGLKGDGSRLLALADEYTSRGPSGYQDNSGEVIYAVNCIDHPDLTSVADAKRKSRGVQGGLAAVRRLPALGFAGLRALAGQAGEHPARDQGSRFEADRGGRHHPRPGDAVRSGAWRWRSNWRTAS